MDDFSGKVALVMGAACPPEIGRAVATRLARAGADVACADQVEIGHTVAQSGGDRSLWVRSKIALDHLQAPDETAAAITFLLSDEASFITGECIAVVGVQRW